MTMLYPIVLETEESGAVSAYVPGLPVYAAAETQAKAEHSNMQKDPERWTTGDEPMTGAQRSYLHTLAEEAQEQVDDQLTKAEASRKIDELQEKTGRGKS